MLARVWAGRVMGVEARVLSGLLLPELPKKSRARIITGPCTLEQAHDCAPLTAVCGATGRSPRALRTASLEEW